MEPENVLRDDAGGMNSQGERHAFLAGVAAHETLHVRIRMLNLTYSVTLIGNYSLRWNQRILVRRLAEQIHAVLSGSEGQSQTAAVGCTGSSIGEDSRLEAT